MTSTARHAVVRRSGIAIAAGLILVSCGGGSDDADSATPATVSDDGGTDAAPAADASSDADAEAAPEAASEPAAEPQPASEPVAPAADGASSAVLVLDGVEHVFEDFAQCLVFSDRFMSGVAFNDADESLEFSYEEPDAAADGEGSEYANTITFEPADGQSEWQAGSVTGGFNAEYGTLDWVKSANTITGTGMFQNIFSNDAPLAPGTFSMTCAE